MWVVDEWVCAAVERLGTEFSEFGRVILPPAVVGAPLEDTGEESREVVGVRWKVEA